jgi:hypothetical protein
MAVEQFARQTQCAHRVIRRVATGGVGQDGELRRRQHLEQRWLARFLADVGAANRHGDDLGAGSIDGGARLREVLVFTGADQQARSVGAAGDDQRIGQRGRCRRRRGCVHDEFLGSAMRPLPIA